MAAATRDAGLFPQLAGFMQMSFVAFCGKLGGKGRQPGDFFGECHCL
jgi:hypothetical protein